MNIKTSMAAAVAFVAGIACQRWMDLPSVKAYKAPAVVEARSFVLKDPQGMTRAEWKVGPNGQPTLEFYDERGKTVWAAPGPRVFPAR